MPRSVSLNGIALWPDEITPENPSGRVGTTHYARNGTATNITFGTGKMRWRLAWDSPTRTERTNALAAANAAIANTVTFIDPDGVSHNCIVPLDPPGITDSIRHGDAATEIATTFSNFSILVQEV